MPADPACAVISIKDNARIDAPLAAGWGPILRLSFYDINCPLDEAVKKGLIAAKDIFHWESCTFNRSLARETIEWLKDVVSRHEITHVMVHCDYGHSRSRGIAKFIAELYGLPFSATYFNVYVYDMLCMEIKDSDLHPLRAYHKPKPMPMKRPLSYFEKVREAALKLIHQ